MNIVPSTTWFILHTRVVEELFLSLPGLDAAIASACSPFRQQNTNHPFLAGVYSHAHMDMRLIFVAHSKQNIQTKYRMCFC